MRPFYVLRGGRVVKPKGHWTKDAADRAALATLRRHPKSVCRIVEIIDTHTLASAELGANKRVRDRVEETIMSVASAAAYHGDIDGDGGLA